MRTARRFLPALALGLAAAVTPARASAADPDPWLGPDKALHFGISAGLAGGGYALSALGRSAAEHADLYRSLVA